MVFVQSDLTDPGRRPGPPACNNKVSWTVMRQHAVAGDSRDKNGHVRRLGFQVGIDHCLGGSIRARRAITRNAFNFPKVLGELIDQFE